MFIVVIWFRHAAAKVVLFHFITWGNLPHPSAVSALASSPVGKLRSGRWRVPGNTLVWKLFEGLAEYCSPKK